MSTRKTTNNIGKRSIAKRTAMRVEADGAISEKGPFEMGGMGG